MNNVLLVVFDGYGLSAPGPGNAVYLAHPDTINAFTQSYPNTQLKASGEAVGLPESEVGNTEVGHINMGAGRIVYENLPRINLSIADGGFFKNEELLGSVAHIQKTKGIIHVMGLLGGGTVHASVNHLYALLHFFHENRIKDVAIHIITDGRDSPPEAAKSYIKELQEHINIIQVGYIATIMGRYYAMDRDRRWDRVEKAYECLTEGIGKKVSSWESAIDASYADRKTDEFIEPTIIEGEGRTTVQDGDSFIFYNYRIDRPRELTKAFVLPNFEAEANKVSYDPFATKYYKSHLKANQQEVNATFKRKKVIKDLYFVTMTEYEQNLPVHVAFPRHVVKIPLGRVLADYDIPQLRMAESEKERFVTYYFNGLRETAFPFEDRIIIPSPKVATYDLKPEMSAYEITDNLIQQLTTQKYRFILVNFANADMVGHTGNLQASIKAVQTLDICIKKIVNFALQYDYTVLITADHGNVEEKINPQTGGISTEHTHNPVPFIAISKKLQGKIIKLQSGTLADIAPTVLAVMGINKPSEMTGRNLLEEVHMG